MSEEMEGGGKSFGRRNRETVAKSSTAKQEKQRASQMRNAAKKIKAVKADF